MGRGSRANNLGTVSRKAVVAALLATTAIASSGAVIGTNAYAQTSAQASFNIPAGPLNRALASFGSQSGTQLSYEASIANGKTSPGITGAATREQALAQILQGSGLVYRFTDGRNVLISQPAGAAAGTVAADGSLILETITIQGQGSGDFPPEYAGGQVAAGGRVGMLGNKSIMDTPFSVTSYTEKTIADKQAKTLADVMANEPTVHVISSGLTSTQGAGDWFTIRGHTVRGAESSFDGIPNILAGPIFPVEGVERIEVLRGPSALLNGQLGALGGMINIVPKRAMADPITRVTADFTSRGLPGGHIDVGRRFGTNQEWGIRLNGVYRNGSTPIHGQSLDFGLGSIALDYKGDRFRASLDAGYVKNHTDSPNYGYGVYGFTGAGLPTPPDASRQFGLDWTYADNQYRYVVAKAEYDLSSNWMLYGALGASDQEDNRIHHTISVLDPTGLANVSASRFGTRNEKYTAVAGIQGEFDTGPVKHQVNINASYNKAEYGWDWGSSVSLGQWNIYDGRPNFPFPGPNAFPGWAGHKPKTSDSTFTSIAIADTLSFWDDKLAVTLGLRYQTVDVTNWDRVTLDETSSYKSDAITPAFAVVWRPTEQLSIYGNYIEGLTEGRTAPDNATNAGEVFPPYVTKQMEAGIKYDFGTFATTLSVYQMEKQNLVSTLDPNSGLYTYSLDGEQRHRGIEFSAFGEVYPGLRMMGGVAYNEAKLLRTQGGLFDGHTVNGVPYLVGKFGVEWDVPSVEGLTLSGRVIATSKQYLNDENIKELPAWARLDLGVRYRTESFGRPLTIRASAENVLGTNYWASVNSNNLTLGAPRTFKLSATMDF